MTNKTIQNYMTFAQLFHALPLERAECTRNVIFSGNAATMLNRGIVVIDGNGEIVRNDFDHDVANLLMETFGADQAIWNQTFHKSWEKVQNAPIEQLVFEQLAHYFSTYGMEFLGLEAVPMLPVERVLADPAMRPNVKAFTIIRLVGNTNGRDMFHTYLTKTLAPNKNMVNGIIDLMKYFNICDVDSIASFELKVACCDQNNIVPTDPVTFLRYLVYKATGSTMLIKNKRSIEALHYACETQQFGKYFHSADLAKLASIFYRFKPIFLAFRADNTSRPYINTLRRLAPANHKPMSDVNVQNLSKLVAEGRMDEAKAVLAKCTGRQLVKVFNFTLSEIARIESDGASVYNIRNGKLFVDEGHDGPNYNAMCALRSLIGDALTAHYAGKLEGKFFYLPDYISYTVPVTEKQFIGNIPYGSFVTVPDNKPITMGVAWENFKGQRTDIDLHMTSPARDFGWNAGWRASDMVYSGDMTDATNGAAEVYRFTPNSENKDEVFLLTVNNYTGANDVPFKFLVTEENIQPNHDAWRRSTPPISIDGAMFPPVPVKFDEDDSMSLGLVYGNAFFFYGGELGASIVPKRDMYRQFIGAMIRRVTNMVQLRALIVNAGGLLVDAETFDGMTEEQRAKVIDLSPANLTARAIFDLVDCAD